MMNQRRNGTGVSAVDCDAATLQLGEGKNKRYNENC